MLELRRLDESVRALGAALTAADELARIPSVDPAGILVEVLAAQDV
jgi:hypothetical protein